MTSRTASAEPVFEAPNPTSHRIPELDGIRGIAIGMVLMTHLFSFWMIGKQWNGFANVVFKATDFGWAGVDLFFVLSGFLITGILIRSKGSAHYARNFYARRCLRIIPLYLLVLLLLGVLYRNALPTVILGLFMSLNLRDLFHIPNVSGAGALWSLAVEEHFYLLWPWIVKAVKTRTLGIVCAFICIAEPIVRATTRFMVDDVYFYTWYRMDALAYGALIAIITYEWKNRPDAKRAALRLASALLGVPLVIVAFGSRYGVLHRGNRLGAGLQFTVVEMAMAGFLLAAVTLSGSHKTAVLRIAPLLLLGDLSYCLYVIHQMVLDLMDLIARRFMDVDAAMSHLSFLTIRAVIAIPVLVALAMLSGRYYEKPILRLKRYFAAGH